jgi:mannosylglycerate hydrolase
VNSLGNRRSEIVEVRINNVLSSQKGEWHVKDAEGKEVPSQQVSPVYIKAKELDFGDRPSQVEWNRRVVGLEYKPQVFYIKANEIPGVGFRKYTIVKGKANSPLKEECIASETSLENEKIRVSINKNGTLNIQDKDTRQLYSNLNIFEDGGDCTPLSGGYHYQAPLHDVIYTSEKLNAKTRSLASGPLVAALEVRISLPIPEKGDTIKEIRSKKLVPLNIRTIVSLKSGIPWVEIEVIIENSATDHRLRVVFPTGINSDTLRAQGHFDVMRRAITKKPWPTESMREFIYLEDKNKGFALFTTGLHEYEAKENGRIALTLFRSNTYVTQLWWPGVQSIDARILGKSRYRYGIMPTRPGISDASLIEYARKFNRPLTAVRCFWGPPYLRKLVESCQKEFIITAVKKHWQRDTLIIRFFNANSRRTTGIIRFGKNINEAYKTDMKEERQERLKVTYKNCVQVKARPKEIFTMEVLFSKEEKVLSKSTG